MDCITQDLNDAKTRHPTPRLWIGPEHQAINLDHEQVAHSAYVTANPEIFGIDRGLITRLINFWESNELDFDYDYIICLAEQNGWSRVSRDCKTGTAISTRDVAGCQRSLLQLDKFGLNILAVDLEIERLSGNIIQREHSYLDGQFLKNLRRRGILPRYCSPLISQQACILPRTP